MNINANANPQRPVSPQATRDHDMARSTAQDVRQHEERGDAASDADSEDDLLNQVTPLPGASGCMLTVCLCFPAVFLHTVCGPFKRGKLLCKPARCEES
jgi:hypothetical protein